MSKPVYSIAGNTFSFVPARASHRSKITMTTKPTSFFEEQVEMEVNGIERGKRNGNEQVKMHAAQQMHVRNQKKEQKQKSKNETRRVGDPCWWPTS
jgi:hypothetical protein